MEFGYKFNEMWEFCESVTRVREAKFSYDILRLLQKQS